jgi:N-acetyl-anhydromuramyl-L-alanine amidase AmpD
MPGFMSANRPGVDERFPLAGFTIRTGITPSWFEAVFFTRKDLLENKDERTASNFYSTRGLGPLPAPRGEAVFIVPPEVMARFAGADRVYYAIAMYRQPTFSTPEVVRVPPDSLPYIAMSKGFTGRMRRSMIQGGGRTSLHSNGYAAASPESLTWAGDTAPPGKMEPVQVTPAPSGNGNKNGNSTPTANVKVNGNGAKINGANGGAKLSGNGHGNGGTAAQSLAYDDGFGTELWSRLQAAEENEENGIEGPIPDAPMLEEGQAARAFDISPEYPQASRFVPAHSGNYRASSSPRTINRIVIHITDGNKNINGPISWFQNPSAKVSAHYIVGQDGEVVQMVQHNDVAWHASRANGDSIGIEHVANTRGLLPTTAEYCASAALVNWLATQYNIPMDRTHILGHSEADTKTTHTACPNAVWDWDYFMGMVTSGTCYEPTAAQTQAYTLATGRAQNGMRQAARARTARASRALGGNFDTTWRDVQLVPQPTGMSCWAAAASMVVGWRDQVSIDPAEIARGAGRWEAYKNGLNPADVPTLANAWGLSMEPPQSYTIEAFRQMIAYNGPLWVAESAPGLHAIVVHGIYGDGTPEGTYVRIKDPWEPNVGSEYTLSFQQFVQQYEAAATDYSSVNIQILHSGGTNGRTADSSTALALSLSLGRSAQPRALARARARALNQTFSVNWSDVQLVPQPTGMSCWAASAAMIVGWRDKMSIDPSEIASGAGQWAAFKDGLNPADVPSLAQAWGLVMEPPQSYTIEGFRQLLENDGPLWVGEAVPGLHAIVVHGIYGDGTPDGTSVRIKDPWEPGVGSEYNLTFRQFVQQYEAAAINFDVVNIQILHSGGTAGRTATAQAFQAPAPRRRYMSRAKDGGAGVAVAVGTFLVERILDNKGDVEWRLDQARGKKHVNDDPANEGTAPYQNKSFIVRGPRRVKDLIVTDDLIYFDAEVQFQYNGRSIANITILPYHAEDAIAMGLVVEAKVQDDAQVYRGTNGQSVAGMKINFSYHFEPTVRQDTIALGETYIYGDGDYRSYDRWTQN